jgi:hypothetical protein
MNRPASNAGHVVAKVLLLVTVLGAALGVIYYLLQQVRLAMACGDNLRAVYRALELYEMERGTLPRLAYFPDNALEDGDSLRVVLEQYGASAAVCVCPHAPEAVAELGLSYLWNVRLNGKKISREDEPEWMLVDIQALSSDVSAPHLGRYSVLYTDGTVERISDPMEALRGL